MNATFNQKKKWLLSILVFFVITTIFYGIYSHIQYKEPQIIQVVSPREPPDSSRIITAGRGDILVTNHHVFMVIDNQLHLLDLCDLRDQRRHLISTATLRKEVIAHYEYHGNPKKKWQVIAGQLLEPLKDTSYTDRR